MEELVRALGDAHRGFAPGRRVRCGRSRWRGTRRAAIHAATGAAARTAPARTATAAATRAAGRRRLRPGRDQLEKMPEE